MVSQALKCGRFGLSWWSYSVSQHSTTIPGCLCSLSHQLRGPPQNCPKKSTKRFSRTWPLWWLLVESETRFFSVPCLSQDVSTETEPHAVMAPHRINGDNFFLASRTRAGDLACRLGLCTTKQMTPKRSADPRSLHVSPLFLRPSAPLREFLHSLGRGASQICWGLCNDHQLLSLHTALAVPKCPSYFSRAFEMRPMHTADMSWVHPSHCMGAASFQAKLRPPHECLACCHLPSSTAKVQEVIYKKIGLSKFQPCSNFLKKLESRFSRLIWAWENQRYQG